MKWIRTYESFRNFEMVKEDFTYNRFSCKSVVEMQMKKAFSKSPQQQTTQSVLQWVKSTLLNVKSEFFLVYPMIEELKTTGGKGGGVLPSGYGGPSKIEPNKRDHSDINYYKFMANIFKKQIGLLADPDDIFPEFKSKNTSKEYCGLYFIELMCQQKFENQVPFEVIKYCVKKVRREVAKSIKFIQDTKPGVIGGEPEVESGGVPQTATGLEINSGQSENKEYNDKEKSPNVLSFCFLDETPTNHIPELKQILLKVEPREVDSKLTPKEIEALIPQVAIKKRQAFISYFKSNIYPKFQSAVESITDNEVEKYLKEKKIDSSGKKSYAVGDEVIFLRKEKNIKDWNNLNDDQKQNLDDSITKEVVGKGTISSVSDDGNYKIDLKSGKVANKTTDEILKKIENSEQSEEESKEKEEDKKPEEEGKESEEKNEKK